MLRLGDYSGHRAHRAGGASAIIHPSCHVHCRQGRERSDLEGRQINAIERQVVGGNGGCACACDVHLQRDNSREHDVITEVAKGNAGVLIASRACGIHIAIYKFGARLRGICSCNARFEPCGKRVRAEQMILLGGK